MLEVRAAASEAEGDTGDSSQRSSPLITPGGQRSWPKTFGHDAQAGQHRRWQLAS